MNSVILATVTRSFKAMLLVVSVAVLVRGHNDPGGGFAGGLIAAAAFALPMLASGARPVLATFRLKTAGLLATGGAMLLLAFAIPLFRGAPALSAYGAEIALLGGYYLSTHLLFDSGVYLLVLAAMLLVLQAFAGKEVLD